jgi:hypothetical protein
MIDLDAIIGIVLALPIGILIGYMWRGRISRLRRAEYLAERERERRAVLGARKASIGDSIDHTAPVDRNTGSK